jgi:beta-phosphoglucomutase-like phosphatase (HAD superfamily)
MGLRAVFFDLDDTLCDTTGTCAERARKAFDRVRAEYPQLDVDQLCGRALEPRTVRGVAAILEELGLSELEWVGQHSGAMPIITNHFACCLPRLKRRCEHSRSVTYSVSSPTPTVRTSESS